LLGVPFTISLVAMNYHFVNDVIAGVCLGHVAAADAAALANLRASTS
jgi:hypothetical protein